MLRRLALVRPDVSEELSAVLFRVTRIGELGTTLALTSNRRTLRRNYLLMSICGLTTGLLINVLIQNWTYLEIEIEMKNAAFCDIRPCDSFKSWRFGGTIFHIIRRTRIGELERALAVTSNRSTLRRKTMWAARCNIPVDGILLVTAVKAWNLT
jgi:hypothetical protein